MPCLKILTNIPQREIPKDFVNKIIPILSKVVNKEEYKFICTILGDCQLTFGGESASPGAVATLESIGNLGPNENKVIVKGITDFVQKELKIQPNRFFMTLYDVNAYAVGINGNTVA